MRVTAKFRPNAAVDSNPLGHGAGRIGRAAYREYAVS